MLGRRWTKRPQNFCRSCGYSWYPQGHNRSSKCPNCKSPKVDLALEACLRAIVHLLAAPFILLAWVLWALAIVTVFTISGIVLAVRFVARPIARLLGIAVVSGSHASGAAAKWSARAAVPVGSWIVERSRPLLVKVSLRMRRGGYLAVVGASFLARWVASAKEDLLGDADRDVNPVSLIAKLLTLAVTSTAIIIVAIKIIRGAFLLWV